MPFSFNNPILENIWNDRYRKNDESLDDNFKRVARYCAKNDDEYDEFYNIISNVLFLPAGRTMSNSGIGKDLTLNNCFVAPQIMDDLKDIFDKVSLGARTHQKGGGIGYDFSQLRPKGSPTSNDAIASGAVSFMDVFNAQTATILQGNRRGANMGVMNVYDIDIEDFINAKSYDEGKLNHFNVSVMVDDDFITAVRNNENIYLHHPVYNNKGEIEKNPQNWVYKKEVSAKQIWDTIIRKAYENGEPGVFFYDNLNKDNNLWYIENIVCSNPCFTGDMKLLTQEGYKTFEELCDSYPMIINKDGKITQSHVWCSGQKETISLKLDNGNIITCTPNHIFMDNYGNEIRADDMKGRRIFTPMYTITDHDGLFVKLGFIQGDGCTGRLKSNYHNGLEINIGYKDDDILDVFNIEKKENCRSYYVNGYNDILKQYGFDSSQLPERKFPETYDTWDKNQKLSFLRGCYSANGSVIQHYRISYKTTCYNFASKLVQSLSEFGISAYITTNKEQKVKFDNGEYLCKESYNIDIGRYNDIVTFYRLIGFVQEYKTNNLKTLILERAPKIVSIKDNGVHKVYDFTEPETHWGIVNDSVVHNCAEYLAGTIYGNNPTTGKPLNSSDFGGACNLGSLFLHNFVKCPFTKKAYVDYDKLKETIYSGVKLLDNIIDINKFPDPIYENYQTNFRTIGFGITGLADMLVMLNFKYNSPDAIEFVDHLMDFISLNIYKASIELAKQRGSFPFLDKEKFLQSGYLRKHRDRSTSWHEVCEDIKEYGIRNAKLISIAPTGTLSLTFGNNCSSGLEPIFSLEYERKVKMGGQSDDDIQIIPMRDYAYNEWLKIKDDPDTIVGRDKFITALEMNVDEHINMLSAIAYHVDMSCSKTINVPTDYSFEDTKNIYLRCHDEGIKGCTIFRPNEIRQGIMITDENVKANEDKTTTLPRGVILKADDNVVGLKRTLNTGCGTLHCIALFDPSTGKLLETYLSKGSTGGCNNFMIGLSRMISLSARGGIDIHSIVDQLNSTGVCSSYAIRSATKHDTSKGSCCPMAVGNALLDMYNQFKNEYGIDDEDENEELVLSVTDETKAFKENNHLSSDVKCPQCGEPLVFEGGCNVCKSCGWSKCS